MKIELCVHCWRYTRLLCYQLSSLRLHVPHHVELKATVFYAGEDEDTCSLLQWFVEPLAEVGICLIPWELPKRLLFRRSIGRHEAAVATTADWIWMTDADYLFGEDCIDSLPYRLSEVSGPLVFPRRVLASRDHKSGDDLISEIEPPGIFDIDKSTFRSKKNRRAIGGIQIYRGDVAREHGYLPPNTSGHQPVEGDRFLKCRGDVVFRRRQLRTPGVAVDIPNLFRIRHSQCGREVPGLRL